MTRRGSSLERVARYLRQQGELGGKEFFLGELTREEVASLVSTDPSKLPEPSTDPAPSKVPTPAGAVRTPSGSASFQGETVPAGGYEALRASALACQSCALSKTRTKVVFSDGNPAARLMVVGEAPGAQEDKTGRAFVGPAGKLLDLLLASVDLSRRDTAYICNVLKCRPPGNRNPLPDEIQTCTPFLHQQIQLISPEAILAVGTFSGQFLTGTSLALGKLRGEVYSYQGVPVVVTYHPAALLRNPGWTRATWTDLQLLRQVMDGSRDRQTSR